MTKRDRQLIDYLSEKRPTPSSNLHFSGRRTLMSKAATYTKQVRTIVEQANKSLSGADYVTFLEEVQDEVTSRLNTLNAESPEEEEEWEDDDDDDDADDSADSSWLENDDDDDDDLDESGFTEE